MKTRGLNSLRFLVQKHSGMMYLLVGYEGERETVAGVCHGALLDPYN